VFVSNWPSLYLQLNPPNQPTNQQSAIGVVHPSQLSKFIASQDRTSETVRVLLELAPNQRILLYLEAIRLL
jgi:hypothetical protein